MVFTREYDLANCVEIWPFAWLTPGSTFMVVLKLEKLKCKQLLRIMP